MVAERFDVFLIELDPTRGKEIKKTRPCLVISPDEMNQHVDTVIVAPMTTRGRTYPTRVSCSFDAKEGQIILDQIRTIDRSRLVRKLGRMNSHTSLKVLSVLTEMFAP